MDITKHRIISNPRFKDPVIKDVSILHLREVGIKIIYKEELKEEDIKMKFLLNIENILMIVNQGVELKKARDIKVILILLNNIQFLKDLQEYKEINQGENDEC